MTVAKLWDFDKVLRNVLREFALYFLVSLFSCFDHFIGVFDYSLGRSMLSRYQELIDSEEELFLTENCFSQEVLEPNFSMGRTHRCAENFSRP